MEYYENTSIVRILLKYHRISLFEKLKILNSARKILDTILYLRIIDTEFIISIRLKSINSNWQLKFIFLLNISIVLKNGALYFFFITDRISMIIKKILC